MPREIVVLVPNPPDARALVEAGAAVDGRLVLRTIDGGAVHQLCREVAAVEAGDARTGRDAAGTAADVVGVRPVLSVHQPLRADDAAEVERLLPGLTPPGEVATWSRPFWWVEALAPWGTDGDDGVAVACELARHLGGVCVVQDGT